MLVLWIPGDDLDTAGWLSACFGADAWIAAELHCGPNDCAQLHLLNNISKSSGLPLVAAGEVAGGLTAGDLLRIPGALEVEVAAVEWGDAERELTAEVARRALVELVSARESEGARLVAILLGRLEELEQGVAKIDALRAPALAASHAAIGKRLSELLGEATAIDPLRLAQEAAVLADRSDVSEEVDRLKAHFEHFREVARGRAASGKRLDFLTQEIFRELNTLAAKCRHPEVVRLVLDAKVLCEQIREQVQNVE